MAALRMASSFLLSLLIAAAAAAARHLPAPSPAPARQLPAPAPAPAPTGQIPSPAPAPAHQPPAPAPAPAQQPPCNIHINGTVPCSVGPMSPATPVFPKASVLLQCVGQVICNTTSNANGAFAMDVSSDSILLLSVLKLCKLVIATPPSACNPALPTTGYLKSSLKLLSDGTTGFPIKCIPGNFSFVGP